MTDETIDQSDRTKSDRKPGPPLGDMMYLDDALRLLAKEARVAQSVSEEEDGDEDYPTVVITADQPKSSDRQEAAYQKRLEAIIGKHVPIKSQLPDFMLAKERLERSFPWFEAANTVVLDAIALAHMSQRPPQLPNVLLLGPSGCGKTEYARLLADLFGTPLALVPVAGSSDDCGLASIDRRWSTSQPSLPIRRILTTGRADHIICLDELDKSVAVTGGHNGSVQGSLMQMLSSRKDYLDLYVSAPVDLTSITFMATANQTSTINGAVLDRMLIVQCLPPQPEHFDVLLDSCVSKLLSAMDLPVGLFEIDQMDRDLIRNAWLRLPTPSIRTISKIVEKLVSDQARDLLEHRILH